LGIVEGEEIDQSECDESGGNVESDGSPAFLLEDECALCKAHSKQAFVPPLAWKFLG
jgi:hypothetical protein